MAMRCQQEETQDETMKYAEEELATQVQGEVIAIIRQEEAQRAKDEAAKQQTEDPEDELRAKLQHASEKGVDPRGSLAGRFARDDAGGNNDEYKKLVGRKEKAEFRRRWAASRLKELTEVREREDEWQQVDTTKGEMVSIKELIKREGADAKKYIEKCAALGPPWIFYDPMWERYECMVMTRSHQDIFTKAWRLRCARMQTKVEDAPPTKVVVTTAQDMFIYIYIDRYG